ncbi:MAG: hypothetical protein K2G53_01305 [Muribaculaceae bacterium]|nr:hypothetical protein [Muribaculaceae bacterium]
MRHSALADKSRIAATRISVRYQREVDPRSTYPRRSAPSASRQKPKKVPYLRRSFKCFSEWNRESFFKMRNFLYALHRRGRELKNAEIPVTAFAV